MSFIAGRYTATLGAASLGQTQDGIRTQHQIFKQLITGDAMAETPQDGIFRGAAMFVNYTLIEYDAAAAQNALWPYGTFMAMGVIGRLDSDLADQLILTAVSGTPAASTPATLTLPLCMLAENYPVELLFAPELRTVPIRQRVYPNSSGVFGTVT